MKLNISYRSIEKLSRKPIREKIRKSVERHLKPYVSTFNESQLSLHATVEKKKNDYRITLRLNLPPKKTLVSNEKNEDIEVAINRAVKEMARTAERHHARVSGRELWKRKSRRQRIKKIKTAIAEIPVDFQTQLREEAQSLEKCIKRYIRQELAYLRANGDLLADYPSFDDIYNEALLQFVQKKSEENKKSEELYVLFLKIVNEILQREIEQTRLYSNMESLEEEVPEDAIDQAEEMVGEEQSEFFQPDEALHIEDIIEDSTTIQPEELVEPHNSLNAIRARCYTLLGNLPVRWRTVIVMIYQEGLPLEIVAKEILSLSLDQAQILLVQAEAYLIDSLGEQGVASVDKEMLSDLLKVK